MLSRGDGRFDLTSSYRRQLCNSASTSLGSSVHGVVHLRILALPRTILVPCPWMKSLNLSLRRRLARFRSAQFTIQLPSKYKLFFLTTTTLLHTACPPTTKPNHTIPSHTIPYPPIVPRHARMDRWPFPLRPHLGMDVQHT